MHLLFSATSAAAKQAAAERSGEMLPITVCLTEKLQPQKKKKKIYIYIKSPLNVLYSTRPGANKGSSPSATTACVQ